MDLRKSSMYHSWVEHIDIHYHKIHNVIKHELLRLVEIHIKKNLANMFTNIVTPDKLKLCTNIASVDDR